MTRYYRSRFLAYPVVYIQKDDTWRSYGRGGETRKVKGEIPEHILKYVTEITQAEAEALIAPRQAAHAGYVSPQPRNIGGYLVFVIVWLGLTIIGGLSVFGTTTEFAQLGVPSAVTDAGMSGYGNGWVAIIIIDILGALALIAAGCPLLSAVRQRTQPSLIRGGGPGEPLIAPPPPRSAWLETGRRQTPGSAGGRSARG